MRLTVAALAAAGAVSGRHAPKDGRLTFVDLMSSFLMIVRRRAAQEDWLLPALQGQLSACEHGQLAAAVKLLGRLAEF